MAIRAVDPLTMTCFYSYLEVYDMIRDITGVGEGNGPVISIHDGFSGNLSTWDGYLTGSDRIVMDSHPYLAFDTPNADPYPVQMLKACDRWGPMFNLSMANVGFTYAGEFSLGINDCGQYLNGVIDGIRYDGTYTGVDNVTGSCDMYMDVSLWDNDFKAQVLDFALASMDTFQNWFFWTWKIGESTVYNRVAVSVIYPRPLDIFMT
jgi:glucan 1,3-beta-glucosidase